MSRKAARAVSVRRGRWLEYLTIRWNSLEGMVSIGAGLVAGSVALVGFGFDSRIEVLSGTVLLWRLHMDAPERRERAEWIALKLVGASFLLLAVYIGFDAAKPLTYPRAAGKKFHRHYYRRSVSRADAALSAG